MGQIGWVGQRAAAPALDCALQGFAQWRRSDVATRANCLEQAATLLEQHRAELVSLCVREAGKTLPDALDEVREAVDFLRYYAAQARALFREISLPGPTGERNTLTLHGRGVFICISPWNFPLAIFIGQVAAALVCGNSVIAKPAEQTGIIAYRATQLLHQAGVPVAALQLLPGAGPQIGAALCADPRIGGVCFTGSGATAAAINRQLAQRVGPTASANANKSSLAPFCI